MSTDIKAWVSDEDNLKMGVSEVGLQQKSGNSTSPTKPQTERLREMLDADRSSKW